MKFLTEVKLPKAQFSISSKDRVLVMGSCFAEFTAEKLSKAGKFGGENDTYIYSNPFGVIYNPLSMARCAEIFFHGTQFVAEDLVERDGLFHSMDFHGSFSAPTPEEVLLKINRKAVSEVDVVVLTLGTAFVYYYEGRVVANCHKLPENEFVRRRISVDETLLALNRLAELYPNAKFVCSVSPIRHLRDGLSENSVSKATLRLALDQFCAQAPDMRLYFPSYELLVDELRDYRFTQSDMCHPTLQAKEYIFEKFSQLMLTDEMRLQIAENEKIERQISHRPLRKIEK